MAELVEGAPLLREYGVKSFIEGSNPSLSASVNADGPSRTVFGRGSLIRVTRAPVAQLDRVPGYEPGGRPFESVRARQILQIIQRVISWNSQSYKNTLKRS